jgi:hypothetical protein
MGRSGSVRPRAQFNFTTNQSIVATGSDTFAADYQAFFNLASIRIWLRR